MSFLLRVVCRTQLSQPGGEIRLLRVYGLSFEAVSGRGFGQRKQRATQKPLPEPLTSHVGSNTTPKWRLDCYDMRVPEGSVEHFLCLEMVCLSWSGDSGNSSCDCAVLLEIW